MTTDVIERELAYVYRDELDRLHRIEAAAQAWRVARDNWTTRITEKDRAALVRAGDRLAAALLPASKGA